MSTLRAYLGTPGLTDVGLRFYLQNTAQGARISTSIVDEGEGWYSRSGLTLAGDHVRWDGDFDPSPPNLPRVAAREDLALRIAAESGGNAPSLDQISARIIADHGAGSYVALSGGSGAYLVTVTVTDEDDNPLENALVRLSEGMNIFTVKSNASGIAAFNLDAATYDIGVTKDGYQFTPSSIVVSGPANFDVALDVQTQPADGLSWIGDRR